MPVNNPQPTRGEVWFASLDPTIGHEVKKTRPAVVVTSDIYNEHNWVVVIVPLTSHDSAVAVAPVRSSSRRRAA